MTHEEEFRAYMKAANPTSGNNDDRHLSEAQVIAYCREELSAKEHEATQAHLLSCEQCITLFRNARDFLEPARDDEAEITGAETDDAWQSLWRKVQSDAPVNVPTVVAADFQRTRNRTLLARATLPLAASLLISLGAVAWQTWRLLGERRSRQQSQEVAMQLENKQRELEQRLSQIEKDGREQLKRERDQRLAVEAERDQLQDRIYQLGSQDVPVFTAILSSERGTEDVVKVRFSSATKAVRLKLLISKPYEFPEYTILLSDQRGKVVTSASGLRPTGDDGALSLRLNRASLNNGSYQMRLFGGKDKQPLGQYGVSVTVGH